MYIESFDPAVSTALIQKEFRWKYHIRMILIFVNNALIIYTSYIYLNSKR